MMVKKLGFILLFALAATAIPTHDVLAKSHEITVFAGSNARENCPVLLNLTPENCPGVESFGTSEWKLVCGEEEIPAMLHKRAEQNVWDMAFILQKLAPYEKRIYTLIAGEATSENPVAIEKNEGVLDISIGNQPFTSYVMSTSEDQPRPIFYPVFGPQGVRMTRGYPMDFHEGERKDHPHHQSLWVAHGLVNEVDNWSVGKDHGFTIPKELLSVQSGPVCGRFETINDWTAHDGKKILEEHRVVTVWGTPDTGRMLDIDITFIATEEDVKFGDTKEGGLISIRVAPTIREIQDEGTGGVITNSNGEVGSDEAWGKSAPWCDYSGPVKGIVAGFTIMDHPENPFFPTYYHVRDYGLFTANPFGLSFFKRDKNLDGSQILKKGESWLFRYRIYIHAGDVKTGRVEQKYADYADGPTITLR
ncbi:MAG: hypothetical protein C4527_12515 [Candidatus Omnitrophota bacterium]|jgi:hypothetical protein|nr:MAG: hypothetical protein C4527_12515 [Candidatus Omnitrophota bacterium]